MVRKTAALLAISQVSQLAWIKCVSKYIKEENFNIGAPYGHPLLIVPICAIIFLSPLLHVLPLRVKLPRCAVENKDIITCGK